MLNGLKNVTVLFVSVDSSTFLKNSINTKLTDHIASYPLVIFLTFRLWKNLDSDPAISPGSDGIWIQNTAAEATKGRQKRVTRSMSEDSLGKTCPRKPLYQHRDQRPLRTAAIPRLTKGVEEERDHTTTRSHVHFETKIPWRPDVGFFSVPWQNTGLGSI